MNAVSQFPVLVLKRGKIEYFLKNTQCARHWTGKKKKTKAKEKKDFLDMIVFVSLHVYMHISRRYARERAREREKSGIKKINTHKL